MRGREIRGNGGVLRPWAVTSVRWMRKTEMADAGNWVVVPGSEETIWGESERVSFGDVGKRGGKAHFDGELDRREARELRRGGQEEDDLVPGLLSSKDAALDWLPDFSVGGGSKGGQKRGNRRVWGKKEGALPSPASGILERPRWRTVAGNGG